MISIRVCVCMSLITHLRARACVRYSFRLVPFSCAAPSPSASFSGTAFCYGSESLTLFGAALGPFFCLIGTKVQNYLHICKNCCTFAPKIKMNFDKDSHLCARVVFITKEVGPIAFPRAIRNSMSLQR